MKRGFDYFSAEGRPIFVWFYWVLFGVFYFFTVLSGLIFGFIPAIILFLLFIPFPIIWIYRIIRHPYYQLDERLQSIDPTLYQELRDMIPAHPQAARIHESPRTIRSFYYGQLMLRKRPISDQRIQRYLRNTQLVFNASQYSLLIWFGTIGLFFIISVFQAMHERGGP